MPSILPILRSRRERRLDRQRKQSARVRSVVLTTGMVLSILLAVFIFTGALTYAEYTRELPSVTLLPHLLNPPAGLLLQPTRIYDRNGLQLLHTFAPVESTRRYIPLSEQNPQHLPPNLINAIIVVHDPQFWNHSGYAVQGYRQPESHPTIAQKLVSDLLLYNEPPTGRRAIRERILAAQITAQYGRTQVMEWYLNSTHFGNYAYGAEAASQLYFGKPAAQLTLAEAAILAAVSETPALNPLDAPQVAIQRGREVIHILNGLEIVSDQDAARALEETPAIQAAPPRPTWPAEAFTNLLLTQLESQIPRERIERGGLVVISTLDWDLQKQASCVSEVYAARLAGLAEAEAAECETARLLPSLPPGVTFPDSSASALILDPRAGQVLAVVGETFQRTETPLLSAHPPGSVLDAFIYLTGFTRGLSPASLTWDIPDPADVQAIQNFDGEYHGPMRLRVALANDYQVPAHALETQMGRENVESVASSFGLEMDAEVSMLELAGAYGVLGTQGVQYGQELGDRFSPVTVLRVESADRSVLLDWGTPQAQSIVTPDLAYLMTHVLSDESARWPSLGRSNSLEIGKPAGAKVGQTVDGQDAWVVGYTPSVLAVAWTAVRGEGMRLTPRFPAALWKALMAYASRNSTNDGWTMPPGVSQITVCNPSGMLPTRECPNLVPEVFLNGSEPVQPDTLYREFAVNRETGLLATVFTPPELVDVRVYLAVPEQARGWAEGAGLDIPPASYDAIQAPRVNPDASITAPGMFAEVSGVVSIQGTAAGEGFSLYRVQVGKGLNPQEWVKVGGDATMPVEEGLLAEWNTEGLSGLYAVQLQVVRDDQRVETAVIQVTVGN